MLCFNPSTYQVFIPHVCHVSIHSHVWDLLLLLFVRLLQLLLSLLIQYDRNREFHHISIHPHVCDFYKSFLQENKKILFYCVDFFMKMEALIHFILINEIKDMTSHALQALWKILNKIKLRSFMFNSILTIL